MDDTNLKFSTQFCIDILDDATIQQQNVKKTYPVLGTITYSPTFRQF